MDDMQAHQLIEAVKELNKTLQKIDQTQVAILSYIRKESDAREATRKGAAATLTALKALKDV